MILWQHYTFPHNTNDSNGYIVADRAGRLHGLRNRGSHMEDLLGVNITARHNDALRIRAAISPEVRDWCAGMSTVIEIRRKCPVKL